MPTSAVGNKRPAFRGRPGRGFTLIELMVVVALIAVATAGVAWSLRDSAMDALERDAQRLAAVLEAARAQSRASGVAVRWQAQAQGYMLEGLPRPAPASTWLSDQTRVQAMAPVVLGPEPLIPPQRIVLYAASQPQQRLWVQSDGLHPFAVRHSPQEAAP